MFYIDVPDMNDSISVITIDEKEYGLRFTYNEKNDYWSFGVYDEYEEPIVAMTKIVPNFPLLEAYSDSRLPDGIFGCISDFKKVSRHSFVKKDAEFVFIPNAELEDD